MKGKAMATEILTPATTLDIVNYIERKVCFCDEHSNYCAVCRRVTCHYGEHSTSQLLGYAAGMGLGIDLKALRNARTAEGFRNRF